MRGASFKPLLCYVRGEIISMREPFYNPLVSKGKFTKAPKCMTKQTKLKDKTLKVKSGFIFPIAMFKHHLKSFFLCRYY